MSSKTAYDRTVTGLAASDYGPDTVQTIELDALVKLKLGHALNDATFLDLTRAQAELRQRQQRLALELSDGKIDPEAYLFLLERALQESRDSVLKILGYEDFEKLFGPGGDHPGAMIDREAFLRGVATH